MNSIQILGSLEIGIVYSLVAVAIFLSFRMLDFADLTVDGTFPLGACISVVTITQGMHPLWGIGLAFVAGTLCGIITALLSTRLKILNLLAGILTMTALYSINLRIMGRPNASLFGKKTILDLFPESFNAQTLGTHVIPLALIVGIIVVSLWYVLSTNWGIGMRAVGANPKMARAQGISTEKMIIIGLGLSNGLVALAGAIFAQLQGFADVSMGTGTIILGLAALIIGEVIFKKNTILCVLIGCVVGAIIYRFVIMIALNCVDMGYQTTDLNLINAILVGLFMSLKGKKHDTT